MFWTSMPSSEQTQNWRKKSGLIQLGRSTDKPRMEYCGDQNETNMFWSREVPLSWKEHIFHTGSSSSCESILEKGSMGRRTIKIEKHDTSVFLLTARFVIQTANERLDWTSSWTKNGTVQAKLSPRSWLHLLLQSTTSSRRKFGISSKLHWRDYFERQLVSRRTGQGGDFVRWSFVWKETHDFDQAGGDSRRRNWLAHIRPTWRTLSTERETSNSILSFPVWWSRCWSLQTSQRGSKIWSRFLRRRMLQQSMNT